MKITKGKNFETTIWWNLKKSETKIQEKNFWKSEKEKRERGAGREHVVAVRTHAVMRDSLVPC